MDLKGIFLLFIVVACAIALIYITRKQKALDKDAVIKPAGSSGSKGTGAGADTSSDKTEEEIPSGPPQNTIYEFSAKSGKFRCPFCDGENGVGAKVCNICGRDL